MPVQATDELILERSGVKYKETAAALSAPRVNSQASAASITPAIETYDAYDLTAQAAALTINNPTGTPYDFQPLYFRIKDNGTEWAFTWGNKFRGISGILPASSVDGVFRHLEYRYNASADLWLLVRDVAPTISTFDPASITYFAAMSSTPNGVRKGLLNDLIAGLRADGVWTKLDWFSVMAAHDAQSARLNAINPAQAFTAIGTPSFTTDRGYMGAASAALNSNWIASTHAVNYAQNSASFGAWCLDEGASNTYALGATRARLTPKSGTNTVTWRINDETNDTVATASAIGLTAVDRSGATAGKIYKNGSELGTNEVGSTSLGLDSTSFYALALNNAGSVLAGDTTRTYAAMFWGASLTGANHTALHSRLSTYLTAVGAI